MTEEIENASPIRLADLVSGLRDELTIAIRRYKNLSDEERTVVPPLKVEQVILETEIVSTLSGDLDGKINVYVVQGSMKGSKSYKNTQKVTIQFSVQDLHLGD